MKTLYQITAELYQEHVVPIINGKQYDTGRSVLITLTDAGAVVVPEAGDMLRLYCRKPDGTVSYLSGTLSGTAVEVELTNQLQALPGVVECELQIGTGAEMVSTPVFRLNVLPSNYDAAAIESTDEFGALETALQTVQQYDTRIAALEDVADGLGDASTYGVANDLTQQTAGEKVLDAYQGKLIKDWQDSTYVNLGAITADSNEGAVKAAFEALTVTGRTCIGEFNRSGIWMFMAYKYSGGQYGMMTAVQYYPNITTKLILQRNNGMDTVTTVADGAQVEEAKCTYTLHTNTSQLVKESWKWGDGTMICAVRNRASVNITNQSGGIYWGIIDGTTWPVAFTSIPTCTFNTLQSEGNGWCWASENASATSAPQIYVGRGTSASATLWVHYIAIGRWK